MCVGKRACCCSVHYFLLLFRCLRGSQWSGHACHFIRYDDDLNDAHNTEQLAPTLLMMITNKKTEKIKGKLMLIEEGAYGKDRISPKYTLFSGQTFVLLKM